MYLFTCRSHTRAENEEDVRLLHTLGLNVPTGEVVLQHADEAFFGVVARLGAARQAPCDGGRDWVSGRTGTICGVGEHTYERGETPREEGESVAELVWADLGEMGRGETSEYE